MDVSDEFVDYVVEQLAGWGEVSGRARLPGVVAVSAIYIATMGVSLAWDVSCQGLPPPR